MNYTVAPKEKEWVRGLLENNEDVFRIIYDAYQRPVFAFAFYLTKSRDTAEEVTQEIFIRLWEKRAQLKPDIFLLAYLKKMTQNLIMDIFRKAARDRNLQDHIFSNMESASQYSLDPTLEKELSAIYVAALDSLPPQQRLIFTMRRDENLSYRQIADKLGLSRFTVRNHLAAAVHSIRHHVSENAELGAIIIAVFLDRHSQ